jgi:hypothetical protein
MSQLLHQTRDQTETHVAELVNAKMIRAKIDRPKGVVVFRAPQHAMELMEGRGSFVFAVVSSLLVFWRFELLLGWSANLKELLKKIDGVGHLVHRELVINSKVSAAASVEAEWRLGK